MANTITSLISTIYEALDVVSRELVGMIPSVSLSSSSERAAKDQTITSFVAPAAAAGDITPGVSPPDDGDQTIGNVQLTISKARRVPVRWNGEQSMSLDVQGGPGRGNIQTDQFAQGFRTLANEMEADLTALHISASRAAGTAGTTPFSFSATKSGFDDVAEARKILVDNGAPGADLQMVLGTAAGAKLRSLAQLNNAQASADSTFLRQGILLPIHGVDLRESGAIKTHTKGTGASSTTDNAGYAVGAVTITLASAGTGTLLAGAVITFAGDANQYVVLTGDADVSGGGTVVLQAPGLRQAIAASTTAITVVATSVRNMLFHRNAIVLATLHSGARIGYGGDFRRHDGYALKLSDLLRAQRRLASGPSSQLVAYLDEDGRDGWYKSGNLLVTRYFNSRKFGLQLGAGWADFDADELQLADSF